ncbi:MAG: MbtH family NRPS accessory protein [Pseudomonadota bacterium]
MFDDDSKTFVVVINDEEQHSIWPVELDIPDGWRALDMRGERKACLDFIEKRWTDIRPLSTRRAIAEDC